MKIKIAQRYRPFTHLPGMPLLMPGTDLTYCIYPTLIRIYKNDQLIEEKQVDGNSNKFTVQQDFENPSIHVWGEGFKYSIPSPSSIRSEERLALGVDKAQDWELIRRRRDIHEILPLWHRLGVLTPPVAYSEGTSLLDQCVQADKLEVADALMQTFQAGFSGGLSPRIFDADYHGFSLPPIDYGNPLALLTEGKNLIRSLFIRFYQTQITLLPSLPPQLHCGRLINVLCGDFGKIDLEWSKKTIRRLIFYSFKDQTLTVNFPKEIKSFRLRENLQEKGKIISNQQTIQLKSSLIYYLDKFSK